MVRGGARVWHVWVRGGCGGGVARGVVMCFCRYFG